MDEQIDDFQVGDCVRVKPGVMCPDFTGLSLAGWQGRVVCVEFWDDEPVVGIAWDSATLAAMPKEFVSDGAAQGLDCNMMYLGTEEVEPAQARDSEADTERSARVVASNSLWLDMGAQGKRILDIVEGTDPDNSWEAFEAWEKYLRRAFPFPLDAKVCEQGESGPLTIGQRVRVVAIEGIDELRGILVRVSHARREMKVPLCDLEAASNKSPARWPLRDYAVWFANR